MVEDAEHALWVGTNKGLARIQDGRVNKRYSASDGLPSSDIRCLFRDRDGVLWIGTTAGLASLSSGRFSSIPGSPDREIRSIGQDKDGNMMVGTEDGFHIQRQGRFQPLTQDGLYMRNANTFFLDRDGLLWVGMNGAGLRLIKDNKITGFNTRDGLYDSELYGISVDDQDRMWIACSRGIFWVARQELLRYSAGETDRITSVSYSPTEALRVIESRPGAQPALWRMKDGRLWFSTVRGLIAFNPGQPAREGSPLYRYRRPHRKRCRNISRPDRRTSRRPEKHRLLLRRSQLCPARPNPFPLPAWKATTRSGSTRHAPRSFHTACPPGAWHVRRVTGRNFDGPPCNEQEPGSRSLSRRCSISESGSGPWSRLLLVGSGWLAYQLHIRRLRERYDLIVSERSCIARELHDTLIQGFSGITMALHAFSARQDSRRTRHPQRHHRRRRDMPPRDPPIRRRSASRPQQPTGLAGAISRAVR